MLLGYAEVEIQSQLGAEMISFDGLRFSDHRIDPLYARLLLFKGQEEYCFLQMDTICIDHMFYQKIAERFADFGILKENIIASASHTHSGPSGLFQTDHELYRGVKPLFGAYNAKLVEETLDQLCSLIKKARARFATFQVKYNRGTLVGVGASRIDPKEPGDPRFVVFEFLREDAKKILMYNFACHPTVLPQSSTGQSADFPGGVAGILKEEYDMVFYTNGSCGDISTRFTRQTSSPKQVMTFAHVIVDKIHELLKTSQILEMNSIQIETWYFPMRLKAPIPQETAQMNLDDAKRKLKEGMRSNLEAKHIRLLESKVEGSINRLNLSKNPWKSDELLLNVSHIKFGDLQFLTIPGELYSSLSNPLREKTNCLFMGYTNGYTLYLPDEEAYARDDYEASTSIFEVGEGERLLKRIEDRLLV